MVIYVSKLSKINIIVLKKHKFFINKIKFSGV